MCFDNSLQQMSKMRMQFGCNVEKYQVNELNFPWEKLLSHDSQLDNFNK